MQIIKRNGNTTIYDDQKIISSIMKANAESKEIKKITEKEAASIAFDAMAVLTEKNEIITTKEIRESVYQTLCGRGLKETAKTYYEYQKT